MEYKLEAGSLSSPEEKMKKHYQSTGFVGAIQNRVGTCPTKSHSTEDGSTSRMNFLNQKQLSIEEKMVHSALSDRTLVKAGEDFGRNSIWVQ